GQRPVAHPLVRALAVEVGDVLGRQVPQADLAADNRAAQALVLDLCRPITSRPAAPGPARYRRWHAYLAAVPSAKAAARAAHEDLRRRAREEEARQPGELAAMAAPYLRTLAKLRHLLSGPGDVKHHCCSLLDPPFGGSPMTGSIIGSGCC